MVAAMVKLAELGVGFVTAAGLEGRDAPHAFNNVIAHTIATMTADLAQGYEFVCSWLDGKTKP